jgi:hypothetical protein
LCLAEGGDRELSRTVGIRRQTDGENENGKDDEKKGKRANKSWKRQVTQATVRKIKLARKLTH